MGTRASSVLSAGFRTSPVVLALESTQRPPTKILIVGAVPVVGLPVSVACSWGGFMSATSCAQVRAVGRWARAYTPRARPGYPYEAWVRAFSASRPARESAQQRRHVRPGEALPEPRQRRDRHPRCARRVVGGPG